MKSTAVQWLKISVRDSRVLPRVCVRARRRAVAVAVEALALRGSHAQQESKL